MNEAAILYEAKKAKKVFLYRNGLQHGQPKCMVVNDKQIRNFSTFLTRATSGLRAPIAVRNIYTPNEGHRVKNLDDLQSGQYYVAGGNEQFKRIKYGSEQSKVLTRKRKTEFSVPHHGLLTGSRYNLPRGKPFVIHRVDIYLITCSVFRNGDEKYRGVRVLLPRRIMGSWELVMELITEKTNLITPAKRLCTLDGHSIHAVSEIQDGGKYIALEGSKPFQRVSYCTTDQLKVSLVRYVPRISIQMRRKPETEGRINESSKSPIKATGPCLPKRKKSIRPMAGRKNKEGREKAIKDHREDSIFGGSPHILGESTKFVMIPFPPTKKPGLGFPAMESEVGLTSSVATSNKFGEKSSSSPNVDRNVLHNSTHPRIGESPVHHSPGGSSAKIKPSKPMEYLGGPQGDLFRAHGERYESMGAEMVLEGGDTEIERPIDQEEAREVEEEQEGDMVRGSIGRSQKELSKDILLESQHVHATVDLSLSRTASSTNDTTTPTTTSSRHHYSHKDAPLDSGRKVEEVITEKEVKIEEEQVVVDVVEDVVKKEEVVKEDIVEEEEKEEDIAAVEEEEKEEEIAAVEEEEKEEDIAAVEEEEKEEDIAAVEEEEKEEEIAAVEEEEKEEDIAAVEEEEKEEDIAAVEEEEKEEEIAAVEEEEKEEDIAAVEEEEEEEDIVAVEEEVVEEEKFETRGEDGDLTSTSPHENDVCGVPALGDTPLETTPDEDGNTA